jgi:hypothetical protein
MLSTLDKTKFLLYRTFSNPKEGGLFRIGKFSEQLFRHTVLHKQTFAFSGFVTFRNVLRAFLAL